MTMHWIHDTFSVQGLHHCQVAACRQTCPDIWAQDSNQHIACQGLSDHAALSTHCLHYRTNLLGCVLPLYDCSSKSACVSPSTQEAKG